MSRGITVWEKFEDRSVRIFFGGPTPRMLSDRDVAPQAHMDVLAAVPRTTCAGQSVQRLTSRLQYFWQPLLKNFRSRRSDVSAGPPKRDNIR